MGLQPVHGLAQTGVAARVAQADLMCRFVAERHARRQSHAGFEYRYSTPGTVEAFAKARRLERVVGPPPEYAYEPGVEDFLRNSRAVVRPEG